MENKNYNLFRENNAGDEIVFSVSEYIEFLNLKIKPFEVKIVGEVGQVQFGPTGHVYFSLKDEKNGSTLNCIIWKSSYRSYGINLKEGMKITAVGHAEIYAQSGRLSFIAKVISLAGEGALKKEYDRIKASLEKEGIFAEERKRRLPVYPHKIGVITSRQGAVIADFLNNLGKFGFSVKMIDSRVEGQEAVKDLLASIKSFKKQKIEVLIIMRGGGSMESMMAFNNELLVREIASFPCPVIAGIGHHKDMPLAAMAADVAVSTPTAAANLLGESWQKAELFLERAARQIVLAYERKLAHINSLLQRSLAELDGFKRDMIERYEEFKSGLRFYLQKIDGKINSIKSDIKNLSLKVFFSFDSALRNVSRQTDYAEKTISLNNPERQLKLGYSIAFLKGEVLRSVSQIQKGQELNIRLADGFVESEVKKINKDNRLR
ncbi:MAG: exodeoxyribonuclease VII large subunit [Candidatus Pacebacteria bacterium]|nr:exodeoxyribonuclease VII large subunit [Candidatus Paceibacterota bacterium]MDD4830858.1 exodeoxyribonuclease VII large subunit [Candidatus Paceibacterota bacterium]MDD4875091.1 exodeoxyribonuclease VII large subunit [Candidatus Paceibacterota bacterium]